jgi:hypothetical protein
MRSMASCAKGGRPVLATGEAAAINATSSRYGTTSSISSRNTALRVRLALRFSPSSACFFMTQWFRFAGLQAVGDSAGF